MRTANRLKKVGLTLIGILFIINLYTQENFIPGYIVMNNGDTIKGQVDYRNWSKNPDMVRFKKSTSEKAVSYRAIDVKEFGVENEIYVGSVVYAESSPTKPGDLTYDSELLLDVDTTFLQTLFRGEKELYYYINNMGKENFYIRQDGKVELLIFKKYRKKQHRKVMIVENKKFIGQLALYMNKCPDINSKINKSKYKRNSLVNLFHAYNECLPSPIYFQKKSEGISPEMGLILGASLTSLSFKSGVFSSLVNSEYNQSMNMSAGFFVDLVLPRNQGKWSINNELLYTTYKIDGKFEEFLSETNYTITSTEFDYSYLKLNSLLRFKYPLGSVSIYLNGGMSNGYAIQERNHRKIEFKLQDLEKEENGLALNRTRRYEQGFIIGTGLKFKNYSIEMRVEKATGMSRNEDALKTTVDRYFLLVGYKF